MMEPSPFLSNLFSSAMLIRIKTIMTSDSPHLDGQYAAFGKVLEGMEVAEEIVNTQRDASDKPLTPQVMASIRVDTDGEVYPFEQLN